MLFLTWRWCHQNKKINTSHSQVQHLVVHNCKVLRKYEQEMIPRTVKAAHTESAREQGYIPLVHTTISLHTIHNVHPPQPLMGSHVKLIWMSWLSLCEVLPVDHNHPRPAEDWLRPGSVASVQGLLCSGSWPGHCQWYQRIYCNLELDECQLCCLPELQSSRGATCDIDLTFLQKWVQNNFTGCSNCSWAENFKQKIIH